MSDLVLKSPRLILRPACAEDAEDVYRNINDWDVIRVIARPPWLDNPASWRVQEKLGFVKVGPCRLDINSRGSEQPGMQALLTRAAFEASSP